MQHTKSAHMIMQREGTCSHHRAGETILHHSTCGHVTDSRRPCAVSRAVYPCGHCSVVSCGSSDTVCACAVGYAARPAKKKMGVSSFIVTAG